MTLKSMEEVMPYEKAYHLLLEHQDEIADLCGSRLPLAIVLTRADVSTRYTYYKAQQKELRKIRRRKYAQDILRRL